MKTISPIVLPPLSALYGAITRTRLALYEQGTLKTTTVDRPVISVGNLTTGGTGKTPLVELIARQLGDHGKKVCILTRGYQRKNPKERVLVSDGQTVFSTAQDAGDEAYLLAKKLTGIAAVICDANRADAAVGAIKHLHSDCFILDDGFQHLQLDRDLNIVTIDATNPWGGGRLLPYGQLREPISGLKRAHCVVITRTEQVEGVDALGREVAQLSGDRPVLTARTTVMGLRPLQESNQSVPGTCGAFCAIGNPESFFNLLRREGRHIVYQKTFRDHHFYSQVDIDSVVQASRRSSASCLITTEKDAVKLAGLRFDLPCFVLETALKIDDRNRLERLIMDAVDRSR